MNNLKGNANYKIYKPVQWKRLSEVAATKGLELRLPANFSDQISQSEFDTIYHPLACFLHLKYEAQQHIQESLARSLGKALQKRPFISAVTGSVSVGKSTLAEVLQSLLSQFPQHPNVDLVVTDGFLFPNAVLTERGILEEKGFPPSFDTEKLRQFLQDVTAGQPKVKAPFYSHEIYDVLPDQFQIVDQPDILIMEGINLLQIGHTQNDALPYPLVSDYLDHSIYLDAAKDDLLNWFLARFMLFLEEARTDENSFYHQFTHMTNAEATDFATSVWKDVNEKNLIEHIEPTRERARMVLRKASDHSISEILLRA